MQKLRLILWDQLSHNISSLQDVDKSNDVILFCEAHSELTYVKHHQKKLAFLLSAQRHFANELTEQGFKVEYIKYYKNNSISWK